MGDFQEQTAVEPTGDGSFRATLHRDWRIWGPAGGYVSAIALRAAGAASRFSRPVSYHCQYLRFGAFEEVDLAVRTLRGGRRTEALRVEMSQGGEPLLVAQVWTAGEGEGLLHDFTAAPEVPDPEAVPSREERTGESPRGFGRNLEERLPDWVPWAERVPGEPRHTSWYRFRPRALPDDPYADAARALMLIDTFSWPAIYGAHPQTGGEWIAPNLDLHLRFHRSAAESEWLLCDTRADLAEDGLISSDGRIFDRNRRLIASGASQLFCRPRPERLR